MSIAVWEVSAKQAKQQLNGKGETQIGIGIEKRGETAQQTTKSDLTHKGNTKSLG